MNTISFKQLADSVNKAWQKMLNYPLYFLNCGGEHIWHIYYDNLIDEKVFKSATSTEHYCHTCRDFFYKFGNIVAIKNDDGKTQRLTLWDEAIVDPAIMDSQYAASVRKLYEYATNSATGINRFAVITRDYINSINHKTKARMFVVGLEENTRKYDGDDYIYKFHHFYLEIPQAMVGNYDRNEMTANLGSNYDVLKRTFDEINVETWKTVRDLIQQRSLLNSEKHVTLINSLIDLYEGYKVATDWTVENVAIRPNPSDYVWYNATNTAVAKLRSTLIGQVAVELEEGKDINEVCKDYNFRVDPQNYKKAVAPITEAMRKSAQKFVEDNGYTESFKRRTATLDDVTDGILHTYDVTSVKEASMFDSIDTVKNYHRQQFDKVPTISIEQFIENELPNAKEVSLYVENNMQSKCMHLTTAVNPESKSPFAWDNQFSWTYANNLSGESEITKAVKEYGGVTNAPFRASLMWNKDGKAPQTDLDFHAWADGKQFQERESDSAHIWFGGKRGVYGLTLDVDIRQPKYECDKTDGMAVENIYTTQAIKNCEVDFVVFNYNGEQASNFEVEVITPDVKAHFEYKGRISGHCSVKVCKVTCKDGKWKITPTNNKVTMTTEDTSQILWGIPTNTFTRTLLICKSPNYWGNNKYGNLQYFFFLEGMKDDGEIRTIHPDHLNAELSKHHKVLDILGQNLMVKPSPDALAGIGFNANATKEQYAIVKVVGTKTKVLKVKF